MFVESIRGWTGRPAIEGVPRRRGIPSWVWGLVDRWLQAPLSGAQNIPTADGATDDELVRVVRERSMDGADRNRHQALMLLYSSTGRRSRR
jgi:hypothetical protein